MPRVNAIGERRFMREKEVKSIMKRIFYDSPLELLFNWSSHLSS